MPFKNLIVIASLALLVACSNEPEAPLMTSGGESSSALVANTAVNSTGGVNGGDHLVSSDQVQVFGADGALLASLSLGGNPQFEFDGQRITSKIGSSGKRKYLNQQGQALIKVNNDGQGKLKLKSEQGVLFWKIKLKTDRIKIADNEEMTAAYKIKTKSAVRAKLFASDNDTEIEIGQARVNQEKGAQVTISGSGVEQLTVVGARGAGVAATMGLTDIPMLHRLIILSELSQ